MQAKPELDRLVYYSVSLTREDRNDLLLDQLVVSLRTLRAYNADIPIWIFWYGEPAYDRLKPIRQFATKVVYQGSYFEHLKRYGINQALALSEYPILHRYFNFAQIDAVGAKRVLYLDCDTIFFDDVEKLFERCQSADFYARAEVGSRRHDPETFDPAYLDEDLLSDIATRHSAAPISPFNGGVMLFNRPVWREDPAFVGHIMSYVWRFTIWMARHPQRDLQFSEGRGAAWLRGRREPISTAEAAAELPLPSPNRWIVEEVAVWLALGHVPSVSTGDFSKEDVSYFAEQSQLRPRRPSVVCHYFRGNTEAALRWAKPLGDKSRAKAPPRPLARTKGPIQIPKRVAASRLMRESGGFAIFAGLPNRQTFDGLRREARALFPTAKHEERWAPIYPESDAPTYEDDRRVAPRRRKKACGGGSIQSAFYQDERLHEFLSDQAGVNLAPSGERGSYAYYMRPDDFVGLHRDTDYCDLVLLTVLEDTSDPAEFAGSTVLYPGRVDETCEQIGRSPLRGAEAIKLRPGQTMILYGGAIPHRVAPIRAGQSRIISALCFSIASC